MGLAGRRGARESSICTTPSGRSGWPPARRVCVAVWLAVWAATGQLAATRLESREEVPHVEQSSVFDDRERGRGGPGCVVRGSLRPGFGRLPWPPDRLLVRRDTSGPRQPHSTRPELRRVHRRRDPDQFERDRCDGDRRLEEGRSEILRDDGDRLRRHRRSAGSLRCSRLARPLRRRCDSRRAIRDGPVHSRGHAHRVCYRHGPLRAARRTADAVSRRPRVRHLSTRAASTDGSPTAAHACVGKREQRLARLRHRLTRTPWSGELTS